MWRGKKGLFLVAAVAVALVAWSLPNGAREAVESAKQGDLLGGLLGGLGLGNASMPNGTTREIQVKYQSGSLEDLGVVEAGPGAGNSFDVTGTGASGSQARFELVCGAKVCGTVGDVYQEPLTYWIVTVPPTKGLTKLTVTAGAAYLEVPLG